MVSRLMIQGTGSDVGKSLLVAGLARAALRRGIRVAPFKPQNMSNNAAVVADECGGFGEIGRAQALQAQAAGIEPIVHMNPVLLKPQSDRQSQIVVQGKLVYTQEAKTYWRDRSHLMVAVLESFHHLTKDYDLILVEGAGSPAEINLRAGDIANMGFARATQTPVILAGDIDRGGVIAALIGTQAVLEPEDAALIRGFIINRFRGDPALFADGLREIEARTAWRSFGILPWVSAAARLPAEDAVVLDRPADAPSDKRIQVCVPMLSRIANFDDLDPLRAMDNVEVRFIPPGTALPVCDLIILPGTKAIMADMDFVRQQGWDIDIHAHVRRGGRILGLCGGYQMLGRTIADPMGLEGKASTTEGLGLLDIQTEIASEKVLTQVSGTWGPEQIALSGYEIHMGRTQGPGTSRPFLQMEGHLHGAQSADGRVMGAYLHGLFTADDFRMVFFEHLFGLKDKTRYQESVEDALDAIAEAMEQHLDVAGLLKIAGL